MGTTTVFSVFSMLFLLLNGIKAESMFDQASKGKCVPIDIEICRGRLPYNYTYFPNTLALNDPHSLNRQAEHFKPLIKTKCHPQIEFFICSVFSPMCPKDYPQEVTSCRPVCLEVKRDCSSILAEFEIGWPDILDCDRFPNEPTLCMDPSKDDTRHSKSSHSISAHRGHNMGSPLACPIDLLDMEPGSRNGVCASQCGADLMFERDIKIQNKSWMFWWGTIVIAVSTFTFLTFLIDIKRFRYPQKCIMIMSFCFLGYSLPHIAPTWIKFTALACQKFESTGKQYLIYEGGNNMYCMLSFLFTFYFGTAAANWWLMFAFTWYLSAARKWIPEGVEAYSCYLHFYSWGSAALMTIIVLVTHKVDASELSGLCGIGYSDPIALLLLSLIPRTILLVLGAAFVLAGFRSMCQERDAFKRRGIDTNKLDRLMWKTGVFCFVYIVPTVISLVCDSYHYLNLQLWIPTTLACKLYGGLEGASCIRPRKLPMPEVYMLGIMMSLVGGIACFMWILSGKTLARWQHLLCCGICSTAPHKTTTASVPGSSSAAASRPLLEPPTGPLPQPPQTHYVPMSQTHSQSVWKQSKVV